MGYENEGKTCLENQHVKHHGSKHHRKSVMSRKSGNFDQDKESESEGPKKYYRNQRCGRMERTLLKSFGLSFDHIGVFTNKMTSFLPDRSSGNPYGN